MKRDTDVTVNTSTSSTFQRHIGPYPISVFWTGSERIDGSTFHAHLLPLLDVGLHLCNIVLAHSKYCTGGSSRSQALSDAPL